VIGKPECLAGARGSTVEEYGHGPGPSLVSFISPLVSDLNCQIATGGLSFEEQSGHLVVNR
jgi:hypothetical protein